MPKTLSELNPSRGILRFGLRFPIILYQSHLGWLLGNRFLMLTTIGRRSGKPHPTVLEVVFHNKQTDEYVIASGWGEKSDWYRNLKNNPSVVVNTSRRQFQATAIQLSMQEAEAILRKYADNHPIAFRELASLISGQSSTDVQSNCHVIAQNIPMILLKPGIRHNYDEPPIE